MDHVRKYVGPDDFARLLELPAHLADILAKREFEASDLMSFHEIAVLVQKVINPHFLKNDAGFPFFAGGPLHPFQPFEVEERNRLPDRGFDGLDVLGRQAIFVAIEAEPFVNRIFAEKDDVVFGDRQA